MDNIQWSVELQTVPTEEPVTTAEVKDHARILVSVDDPLIASYIKAARKVIQAEMNQQLVTATYDLFMDQFPSQIDLPFAPAQSVTHVKYVDTGGTQQTLDASNYQTDFKKKPARIVEATSASWPATSDNINAIEVRYIAGYGAASAVPDSYKTAIKVLVTVFYENRLPPQIDFVTAKSLYLRLGPLLVGRSWRF